MISKVDNATGETKLGFMLNEDLSYKLIQVAVHQQQSPIEVVENAIEILYETYTDTIDEDPF